MNNVKKYDLLTPEGTKDLLYEDCLLEQSITGKLEEIYLHHGYSKVQTPMLEFYDVFSSSPSTSSAFPQESLYKLTDSKGRLLIVRPDSTIPIARMVSTRLKDASLPVRLYYHQTLYTANRRHSGYSDAFIQMGIELIGTDSRRADLEIITTALEVLAACSDGANTFTLEIGDVGFFQELVRKLDADSIVKLDVQRFIESKNYPALNDLLDKLPDTQVTAALRQLPRLFGGIEVFERAAAIFNDAETERILSNLKELYSNLGFLGLNDKIRIDLGMVNRVDYYTGLVMRGYMEGYGKAVLSGGRYDRLMKSFGYDLPATGFAVHLDAVMAVLRQKNSNNSCEYNVPDCLVYAKDGFEIQGLLELQHLHDAGVIAEFSLSDSLQEARNYAANKKISKIIIVGEEGVLND